MEESHVGTSSRRIYAAVTPVEENPSLSAFGEPIPPSRVEAMAKEIGIPKPDGDADPETIKSYESATWEYLRQVIDTLIESADSTNLKSVVAQLFAENIVRGRGLFASACMRCQSKNPHLTPLYAALAGLVNHYFTPVGDLLYRRLSFTFSQMMLTRKYDDDSMNVTIKFLAELINLKIVLPSDAAILISRCLKKETEERVKLAVTLFHELKLRGYEDSFAGVRQELTRIMQEKKLKKEICDMASSVVARRNWNRVFRNDPVLPSGLQWVTSSLEPHIYLIASENPATSQDIFLGDVYRFDKYFLKRERAYYLFRSIILREDYWYHTSTKEIRFSHYCEVDIKYGAEDQQSLLDQLLLDTACEDEVQVCLGIFKYSCLTDSPYSLVPLIELLCKHDDKRYKEALEICFLVVWLMVNGGSRIVCDAARLCSDLLHRECLSWDFVAHLPFEPENMTKMQYIFLESFFRVFRTNYGPQKILQNLPSCCPCVLAAIRFFRNTHLKQVAEDMEKQWKEKNCIKTTKAAQLKKGKYVKIAHPNEATELREEVGVAQAQHKQHHDSTQAQKLQHDGKRKRQRKMPM